MFTVDTYQSVKRKKEKVLLEKVWNPCKLLF